MLLVSTGKQACPVAPPLKVLAGCCKQSLFPQIEGSRASVAGDEGQEGSIRAISLEFPASAREANNHVFYCLTPSRLSATRHGMAALSRQAEAVTAALGNPAGWGKGDYRAEAEDLTLLLTGPGAACSLMDVPPPLDKTGRGTTSLMLPRGICLSRKGIGTCHEALRTLLCECMYGKA